MRDPGQLRTPAWLVRCAFLGVTACAQQAAPTDAAAPAEGIDLEAWLVRLSACAQGPFHPANAWEAEAVVIPPEHDPLRACQSTAVDCTAYFACQGIDDSMSCTPSEFVEHCEGDVLVTCHHYVQRQDCAADPNGNHRCRVDADGYSRCVVGPCDEDGPYCDERRPAQCRGGLLTLGEDCASQDRWCVSADGACVDRVEACERDVCDGDVLRRCASGEGTRDTDCRIFGASCVETDGVAGCVPDAPECEDWDVVCDGSIARACYVGRWWEVDCSRFADATCQTQRVGEVRVASCRLPEGE